jgi:hypothetical protein
MKRFKYGIGFIVLLAAGLTLLSFSSSPIVKEEEEDCTKKAQLIANAWGLEEAREFCQPFLLVKRDGLEIPKFRFLAENGNESSCLCESERTNCGQFHGAIDVCAGTYPLRARQQGNWTIAIVKEMLYSLWQKEGGADRIRAMVKDLPYVENQVYALNFLHIDNPEFTKEISLMRNDLAYGAYDYEYTQAFLSTRYHVSYPYNPLLVDRFLPGGKKKYLVSFRGKCHHKERIALSFTFANYTGDDVMIQWKPKMPEDDDVGDCFHYPHITEEPEYWEMMQQSKFCFLPGGDVHFTMRQMDVLSCGCIPIYIADGLTLPFSDIIPWRSISLFLPESIIEKRNLSLILPYLRLFTEEEIMVIQVRINRIYREFLLDMEGRGTATLHSFWLQHQRLSNSSGERL